MVITVRKSGNYVRVETKEFEKRNGYYVTGRVIESQRKLSLEEWGEFQKLFNDSKFWKASEEIEQIGPEDGTWYMLEVLSGTQYHYVCRVLPDNNPKNKALNDLIKGITKLH